MNEKCSNHQAVFFGTCGFVVFAMSIFIYHVVNNNNRAIASEQTIAADLAQAKTQAQREHNEMMDRVMNRMNVMNTDVIQRLSRLEAKIEAIK